VLDKVLQEICISEINKQNWFYISNATHLDIDETNGKVLPLQFNHFAGEAAILI
jgi:hypothetical protein